MRSILIDDKKITFSLIQIERKQIEEMVVLYHRDQIMVWIIRYDFSEDLRNYENESIFVLRYRQGFLETLRI